MSEDRISWKMEGRINKFKDPTGEIAEFLQNGGSIEEAKQRFGNHIGEERFEKNVALNEGLQNLIDIICGIGSTTLWNSANARVGVGNSNTAPDATQTGLLGASTAFAGMDASYPQRSGQIAIWRGTFGDGQAEFAWEEYTVDNGAVADKNLNRVISSKGTKSAGESWTLEIRITFS